MAFVPPQTIEDALADFRVLADTANIIVDGSNASKRIAAELFNKKFTTCLDIKFQEFENSWNTYSTLSVAEGRIQLCPGTRVNI